MNDKNMQKRGKFITIEGIDGCGKSTLASGLSERLRSRGVNVVLTKEPGGTSLGNVLRQILQEQENSVCGKAELLLFVADRAQHYEEILKPVLQGDNIVISDRWSDSSVAYQGYGRGLDVENIKLINNWVTEGLQPDIVFYIKLDAQTAFDRIKRRDLNLTAFEKEKVEFWNRVADGYERIFAGRSEVFILDGRLNQEDLLQKAFEYFQTKI